MYRSHVDLHGIIDVDLLTRGAKLATDQGLFIASGDGSDIERAALNRESETGFWQQPKALRVIILTCCFGAIVQ
jgi:hypothetical protein